MEQFFLLVTYCTLGLVCSKVRARAYVNFYLHDCREAGWANWKSLVKPRLESTGCVLLPQLVGTWSTTQQPSF